MLLWRLVSVPFKHSASRACYQQTLRPCWSLSSYNQPQKHSYPTAQVLLSILECCSSLRLFMSPVSQVSLHQNTIVQFDLDFSILFQKTSAKIFPVLSKSSLQSQALLSLSFLRYFWNNGRGFLSACIYTTPSSGYAIWNVFRWCCPSHTALQGLVGGAIGANYTARTALTFNRT